VENDVHLLPNPLMPAAVRQMHFIETASSNFLYGLLTAWLLTWKVKSLSPRSPQVGRE
jgi:hypothetical protein